MNTRCCIVAALLASSMVPAAEKLNVLLIVADDLRDAVGCYGKRQARTPHLDRLAARGVRFDRTYVQYPVCNPSRCSFLTGLRCEQTGITDNATLLRSRCPDVVTLPQMLRSNGWFAASYGKIFHLGGSNPAERDLWMDLPISWDEAKAFRATPAGKVIEGRNLTGGKLGWCEWGMAAGGDDDQPDGQIAAHAIRTIEAQTAAGRPWIVGAGFHKPHDPFIAPKKYFDLFPPGSLRLYRDPPDITPAPPMALPAGLRQVFEAFTDADRMEFLRAYYAAAAFMDAQVGRLLDTLDRMNLWGRTLVIFVSDHGYHHNERAWWNKNTLFDRSCRTPLIVCAPDAVPGGVCTGLVELIDLLPTVADYCGVAPPPGLPGRSLRPLLRDPSGPGRSAAFTLVRRGPNAFGRSVRTPRYRYTLWSDGAEELYDHDNDPEETRNLATAEEQAGIVREHRALLDGLPPFSPPAAAPREKRRK